MIEHAMTLKDACSLCMHLRMITTELSHLADGLAVISGNDYTTKRFAAKQARALVCELEAAISKVERATACELRTAITEGKEVAG